MNLSPADPPTPGSTIGGKFRVVSQIGRGGMGVVLAAENLLTGKLVAIKWVPRCGDENDARFMREARVAASIRHPNVVDVYDVVQDGDNVFMVMELLEGEPLTAVLRRGDTPAFELIGLLIEAMRGVSAAHRKQVIHRDIKPDNIFLARVPDRAQLVPKVVDFGISKIEEPDAQRLTQSNTPMGTPLYMSYEQLEARRDVDARADVYAFGVIVYEALTGALPYEANTLAELIFKIVLGPAPAPRQRRPDLPLALDAIVRKAVAKDRVDRYPSVDALIEALTPFASPKSWAGASLSVTARALSDTIPSQSLHFDTDRGATRKRAPWRPALLALVLVAAGALWVMRKTPAKHVTDRSAATSSSALPPTAAVVAADKVAAPPPPSAASAEPAIPAVEPAPAPTPTREPAKKGGVSTHSGGSATRRAPAAQGTASSKRASSNMREKAQIDKLEASDTAEPAPPKPPEAQTPQDSALRAGRPLLQEF